MVLSKLAQSGTSTTNRHEFNYMKTLSNKSSWKQLENTIEFKLNIAVVTFAFKFNYNISELWNKGVVTNNREEVCTGGHL